MERAYTFLRVLALAVLSVSMLNSLIRAVKGPRTSDRIMGINMIGTMALLSICVIACSAGEGWLLDVAFVYAVLSFLAVVVLFIVHVDSGKEKEDQKKGEDV